jgi:3-(3-hydroxy-phenyl)propionate hydroxylase
VSGAIVVGAGPVGLTAALALRARGLAVLIVEAEPQERVRAGSRALFLHRESLELLRALHPPLAAQLVAYGLVWPTRRTFYRGRQVYARTYPPVAASATPPFVSLRQLDTERFLMRACEERGVRFAWNSAVTGVHASDTGVAVTTSGGSVHEAAYAVAADGARSAVRHALGIAMHGRRADGFHVVVDVADADDSRPNERAFHYEHPALAGRNVLIVPFAGGRQVDLQCSKEDDPDHWTSPAAVSRWLPAVLPGVSDAQVLWISKYHFLQVVAQRFVDDRMRVLLAGEAAHLFAPFGARGLNSGIADAVAAAHAIAAARDATSAAAAELSMSRYDAVRRRAAEHNRDAAGAALAHMRAAGFAGRLKRRIAAGCAPRLRRCSEWLENGPYGWRTEAVSGVSLY